MNQVQKIAKNHGYNQSIVDFLGVICNPDYDYVIDAIKQKKTDREVIIRALVNPAIDVVDIGKNELKNQMQSIQQGAREAAELEYEKHLSPNGEFMFADFIFDNDNGIDLFG